MPYSNKKQTSGNLLEYCFHSTFLDLIVIRSMYYSVLTGWNRMQSCEETPYITRMQRPFEISHTLTVLSIEDDAIY
jgi:hypothetical protein